MDKLSKGFGIAKQFAMEKVGKAKATVEPEDFQNMIKAFQANKTELQQLDKSTKGLLATNETIKNAEAAFSASLQNACVTSHGTKLEGESVKLVTSFLPVLNGMQQDRKTYNEALAGLTTGIEKLLATEVYAGDKLISKLDTARLDHDAKLTKVASLKEAKAPKPEEIKIAEAASKAATAEYESVKEQLTKQCQDVGTHKSLLFAEKMPIYTKAMATFYQDCLACIQTGGMRDDMKAAAASAVGAASQAASQARDGVSAALASMSASAPPMGGAGKGAS